jgi:hypothetical protein
MCGLLDPSYEKDVQIEPILNILRVELSLLPTHMRIWRSTTGVVYLGDTVLLPKSLDYSNEEFLNSDE